MGELASRLWRTGSEPGSMSLVELLARTRPSYVRWRVGVDDISWPSDLINLTSAT